MVTKPSRAARMPSMRFESCVVLDGDKTDDARPSDMSGLRVVLF